MPSKREQDKANAKAMARDAAARAIRAAAHDLEVLRSRRAGAVRQHDDGLVAKIDREIRAVEARKRDAERRHRELGG